MKRLRQDVDELNKEETAVEKKLENLQTKRARREPKRLEKLRLKKEEAAKIKMEEDEQIEEMAIETVRKGNERLKEQSRRPKHEGISKEGKAACLASQSEIWKGK